MLENHIRHGEVDVALSFTPRNQEGIESIELTTDRLLLVVHRRFMEQLFGNKTEDMRKKFLQSADITAFKDCPFLLLNKGNRIRMIIDSYLEKVGIHPNIVWRPKYRNRLHFGTGGNGYNRLSGDVYD